MELKTIPIVGDGNCLFRSISYLLFGHQNNHREIRLEVVQKISNEWEVYKDFIVGDNSYSRPVLNIQQYKHLLSQDGEFAGSVELKCVSELYPDYLFRVHRVIAGETVTYDFGSGVEVCDLMFSGNVDSGHYSVLQISHNPQGVKSTKRKRIGNKSLTGHKEPNKSKKDKENHQNEKLKSSLNIENETIPTKNQQTKELKNSLNIENEMIPIAGKEKSIKRKRKGKKSLTGRKETTRSKKGSENQQTKELKNSLNIENEIIPIAGKEKSIKRKRKGKKSLTGRKETTRSKKGSENQQIKKVKNSDSAKCALEIPKKNTDSFDLGLLNCICHYCKSMNFESEQTNRDTNTFSLCCHKGKVKLAPYQHSEFMEDLINGATSTIKETKKRSKNYLNNIRSYNSAFAMVSSESHLDESTSGGLYNFKIHDSFYHRIGPLIPSNSEPKYAQLYIYDVNTAVTHRMGQRSNVKCDKLLMGDLSEYLYSINPFISSFRIMADICYESDSEILMHIVEDKLRDKRRYNDAIQTDVAAIFRSEDGVPPGQRNLKVYSRSNGIRKISVIEPSLDPLAYPLLFPYGDFGWKPQTEHDTSSENQRTKTTLLQYASYRLAIRPAFSLLHRSEKLYLQWTVDMYCRIEGTRLNYIRFNQSSLRADLYLNIADFVQKRSNIQNDAVGKQIILPSSFIGSPRNMHQNYLDAMAIVQRFGKPSLFITMTCNPRWPEIVRNLAPGEAAHYRPDLVVRVFHCKLKELIMCLTKKHVFGRVAVLIYTIEFQKRGLPHAHILLTLDNDDKIQNIADIDNFVSAEIPSQNEHPILHTLVQSHMVHGPCGSLNLNSPCMVEGKCSKQFPKAFNNSTKDNVNGYPEYKRRDNGTTVDVRGHTIDNRYIVPYNPYLLLKFNCHMNVEVCTTVKSIKYIYKYVYKGYDCATLKFSKENSSVLVFDEIDSYLNGRYVGSTEAAWRIFEYKMHFQTHSVIRLDIHLPGQQTVIFKEGEEDGVVADPKKTKLQSFFDLNKTDTNARNLLYTDIPQNYVWDMKHRTWKRRKLGAQKTVTRLYTVNPKQPELFHLRLILLHARGPTCFEDLLTFNGVRYNCFVEAAYARGIATNNNEWRESLNEAKETQMPSQLRQLFGFICGLNIPTNAAELWDEFKDYMCEDYKLHHEMQSALNLCLLEIEDILITHNTSCKELGLPIPIQCTTKSNTFDAQEQESLFNEIYNKANNEQRFVIDTVLESTLKETSSTKVFCLTAHAGCGKTFVQKALLCKLRSMQKQCIPCAFSGIAASLLDGGRTLHNIFKLPIPILENSTSGIKPNTPEAKKIKECSLIIIDEISMCPVYVLNIVDRLLRDLMREESKELLFGGKVVLLCGDFRQTLPVVPHAGPATIIEQCVKTYKHWRCVKQLSLSKNMRVLDSEIEFSKFLRSMGNGELNIEVDLGEDIMKIPTQLICTGSVIEDIYKDLNQLITTSDITERAILAPRNEDCLLINDRVLKKLPGEEIDYFSVDKVITDDDMAHTTFPTEFLNSLNVSGLPPHKLTLKKNTIVMLIRNLNTSKAIINGTRMRVKNLYRNSIDCEILTGTSIGQRILIPRIHLTTSGTLLPFKLQRTQFPLILAFAMTINKAQGQSIANIGIYLPKPVFSHGQLYVAASRARSFKGLRFYITDKKDQGHLRNDQNVYTKNIVYKELL